MTPGLGLAGAGRPGLGLARARGALRKVDLLAGLVAYWSLDELSGTRHDMTGGADAVEVGGTVSGMPGVIGNAAEFVGGTGAPHLYQAWGANLLPGSFTVACWVYMPIGASATYGVVTRFNASGLPRQFAIYYRPSSTSYTWMICDNSGNEYLAMPVNPQGSWHFAAGLYDVEQGVNGSMATYYDGVHSPWFAKARPPAQVMDGGGVHIGAAAHTAMAPFYGLVDEVGIWNRVLTVDELDTLYNAADVGQTY